MNNYSFINQDIGYKILPEFELIYQIIPYKPDIDPRLIQFLRELYFFKQHKFMPCVPLDIQYSINKNDWICISHYLDKYKIKL